MSEHLKIEGLTQEERRKIAERLEAIENAERVEWVYVNEGNEKPLAHVENTKALLNHYQITVRYNEMTKDIEIDIPDKEFHGDTAMNAMMVEIQDRARLKGLPTAALDGHLQLIANQNVYHPVRDWIESEKWDGKSRLRELYDTITTTSALKELLIRKWLISCVAALYEPDGVKSEGLVVLTGGQGIGKTTWVKKLVPNKRWVADGVILNPNDKDSVINVVRHWIVELGELGSTFRRADIDALKSFISKDYDSIRPPYAAKVNNYKRRTILYGSVDRLEFLNDAENRRFWVLNVTEVRPFHDIDLQQLWAEVRCLYLDNEKWYLTREEQELLADSNREFEALSPVLEVLTEKIHNPVHCDTEPVEKIGTRDLLMRLGLRNVTKAEMNEASAWLQKNRFKRDANTKRYHVVIDEYGTIATNKFNKDNRGNVVEFVK